MYEEDPLLGSWVDSQRTSFKNGRMYPERKWMLDAIGFVFNATDKASDENWNFQFKKLHDYYKEHGHCELVWAVVCFTFILNTPTNTTICLPH
jgi:hypothetical protein